MKAARLLLLVCYLFATLFAGVQAFAVDKDDENDKKDEEKDPMAKAVSLCSHRKRS